jgi:hypothetical protein
MVSMPFPHRSHLTDSRIRSGPDAKENASAYERNDRNDQPDRPWMGKLLLSFQRQEALQPAGSVDNPKTVVTSCQAMAKHMLERVSHKKAAHGVQACQPCLADTFSSDRESPFMKAECGKTARSVCTADGGKPFSGCLLRPDSRVSLPLLEVTHRLARQTDRHSRCGCRTPRFLDRRKSWLSAGHTRDY